MSILEVKITDPLAEQDHSRRQAMCKLLIDVWQKLGDNISEGGDLVYDGRRVGSWNYRARKS